MPGGISRLKGKGMSVSEREKDLQTVRDLCMCRICDDSTYPQVYLERIARRDEAVFDTFVDDILDYMGEEWIAELKEEGVSLIDLISVILSEMQTVWDEWWVQMTEEERKEVFDLEEVDWCRNQARQSR